MQKVVIGSDHRGYELKEEIKAAGVTLSLEIEFVDVGASKLESDDDYVDYARALVEKMRQDGVDRGVLLCGSGVGMSIVANKYDGIRCALIFSDEQVRRARAEDDINVIAIPSDFLSMADAVPMIQTFIETPFNSQVKYTRRLDKIADVEENKNA